MRIMSHTRSSSTQRPQLSMISGARFCFYSSHQFSNRPIFMIKKSFSPVRLISPPHKYAVLCHFYLTEDEDAGGRRRSHPRPWSVIARKGPRSESSSLLQQNEQSANHELDFQISPGLLPRLFNGNGSGPCSPFAVDPTFPRLDVDTVLSLDSISIVMPPTPPPEPVEPRRCRLHACLRNLTSNLVQGNPSILPFCLILRAKLRRKEGNESANAASLQAGIDHIAAMRKLMAVLPMSGEGFGMTVPLIGWFVFRPLDSLVMFIRTSRLPSKSCDLGWTTRRWKQR